MKRELENEFWCFDGFDEENPNMAWFERLERTSDGQIKYTEDYRSVLIVNDSPKAPTDLSPEQVQAFWENQ